MTKRDDIPKACVVVERYPFGSSSFPLCVADVFEHDEVTIMSLDETWAAQHGPVKVFTPGTWLLCTTYDQNGDAYHFASDLGNARVKAAYDSFQAERTAESLK